mmetsp:Transcript_13020/g.39679  ORF Transcript_13020/g.39679 Transcript_13020/m.39679 type:complete len:206 (+) Transcript_13020:489-1106(+)
MSHLVQLLRDVKKLLLGSHAVHLIQHQRGESSRAERSMALVLPDCSTSVALAATCRSCYALRLPCNGGSTKLTSRAAGQRVACASLPVVRTISRAHALRDTDGCLLRPLAATISGSARAVLCRSGLLRIELRRELFEEAVDLRFGPLGRTRRPAQLRRVHHHKCQICGSEGVPDGSAQSGHIRPQAAWRVDKLDLRSRIAVCKVS